jgi:hypothetical protein
VHRLTAISSALLATTGAGGVLLEEEPRRIETGVEVVEPDRGRIEMCEERAVYPVRIAGLEEPQGEDLLAMDLGHTLDLHFAGIGAHHRSPVGLNLRRG